MSKSRCNSPIAEPAGSAPRASPPQPATPHAEKAPADSDFDPADGNDERHLGADLGIRWRHAEVGFQEVRSQRPVRLAPRFEIAVPVVAIAGGRTAQALS